MATANVTFRMSVNDPRGPRVQAMSRRASLLLVVEAVRCPGCNAQPGEGCQSVSGRPARPHVLRTNLAKREAAPGLCPLGCGDQLQIVNHSIGHVKSGLFECRPEGADRG